MPDERHDFHINLICNVVLPHAGLVVQAGLMNNFEGAVSCHKWRYDQHRKIIQLGSTLAPPQYQEGLPLIRELPYLIRRQGFFANGISRYHRLFGGESRLQRREPEINPLGVAGQKPAGLTGDDVLFQNAPGHFPDSCCYHSRDGSVTAHTYNQIGGKFSKNSVCANDAPQHIQGPGKSAHYPQIHNAPHRECHQFITKVRNDPDLQPSTGTHEYDLGIRIQVSEGIGQGDAGKKMPPRSSAGYDIPHDVLPCAATLRRIPTAAADVSSDDPP